ncbi:hypothetical protein NDU88_005423 [Pleurodeles waltl]|uniref:Uncharacterized protein n=1 Tax=Pleurodeles waltl TaxID=8319 RepID=A0AAV7MYC0_PLEWA|nr:hypothetical protein NDU88_005423 [Pleurodeles waltl]
MWDKVGPVHFGRYGVGLAHTSGVEGTDTGWRRRGEGQKQVFEQWGDDSVSRIEIQQDGTMAVVGPEQAIKLAESSDGGVEMLSVDSRFCWSLVDAALADPSGVMCLGLRRLPRIVVSTGNAKDIGLKWSYMNLYFMNGGKCFS